MSVSMGRFNIISLATAVSIAILTGCMTTPGREKALKGVIEVKASPTEDLIAVSTAWHEICLFTRNPILFNRMLTPEDFRVRPWGTRAMSWGPPLAFSPDGRKLVAAGVGGEIVQWDVASGAEDFRTTFEERTIEVHFLPDGLRFFTVGPDVRVWSSESGDLIRTVELPEDTTATAASLSPDGVAVLVGLSDGRIAVYREASTEPVRVWQAHKEAVADLAFTPDGLSIASIAGYGDIKIWSPADAQGPGTTEWLLGTSAEGVKSEPVAPDVLGWRSGKPKYSRSSVSFSPNGSYLIATTVRTDPNVFDVHAIYLRYDDYWVLKNQVYAGTIALSRDGRTIITGGVSAPTEFPLEGVNPKNN